MKREKQSHYKGWTVWVNGDDECTRWQVTEAVVTADRVALDVSDDDERYTVRLEPAADPGRWYGRWNCRGDGSAGRADARLFASADGRIALHGNWDENGPHLWFTELYRA